MSSIFKSKRDFYSWLAGFIDGEGCISLFKSINKSSCTPKLTIVNTNLKVLEYIKKVIKKGRIFKIRHKKGKNHKDSYRIIWSGSTSQEVIKKVLPFLVIKKEQAKIILKIRMGSRGIKTSEEEKKIRSSLRILILKLNRKGIK